jgi:hypothetical protein
VLDPRLILCFSAALISIVVLAQFLAALRRITARRTATIQPSQQVRLAVIIPARDEERDLEQSLDSVLSQADVDLEVVVVNDHSRDQTGAIADSFARTDPRVRVLHDPELPPGWLGKCNAMQQAAALVSADVLLFTDADIVHESRCFVTALAEMEERALDFLSLFPEMKFVSFWENVILPTMIGAMAMFATPRIEDPDSSDALAAGAFLMVRSRVFHSLGGFGPIKHEMLDDVAMAKLIKRNGYRVGFRAAPDLLSVRLYKSNRHAFWGMTKNVLEGLNGRLWLAPAVMLLPAFVFGTPVVCAVAGIWEGDPVLATVGAITYVMQYANIWMGRRLWRFHPRKALFFPLVVVPVIACMARALYLYSLRGAVEWRGRTVRVRGATAIRESPNV